MRQIIKSISLAIKKLYLNWVKVETVNQKKIKDRGFVYIAFGESYTKEAIMSIRSLKRYNSEPVALFTNNPHLDDLNDLVEYLYVIQPKHKRTKIDYISQSPFDKSVYLDSDTLIVKNISDIFDLIARYDVAVTMDPARKRLSISKKISEYRDIPYAFPEMNGGVFAYSSTDKSKKFLNLWQKYFYKFYTQTEGWDQPAMRIALWESDVRLACLPPEYNVRSKKLRKKVQSIKDSLGEDHMEPRIYHMHYSPEVHENEFRVENLEELESLVREDAMEIVY